MMPQQQGVERRALLEVIKPRGEIEKDEESVSCGIA
jgi:hypothetical protein